MKQIIVNIETFGDFDMPSTEVLMVAPAGMTKCFVKRVAAEAKKQFADTRETDGVIKFFKEQGFTCASEVICRIGGNL